MTIKTLLLTGLLTITTTDLIKTHFTLTKDITKANANYTARTIVHQWENLKEKHQLEIEEEFHHRIQHLLNYLREEHGIDIELRDHSQLDAELRKLLEQEND